MEHSLADVGDTEILVSKAVKGDPDSLAVLLDRYRDRLKRMVGLRMDRRLQGRVDASDIVLRFFGQRFPEENLSFRDGIALSISHVPSEPNGRRYHSHTTINPTIRRHGNVRYQEESREQNGPYRKEP